MRCPERHYCKSYLESNWNKSVQQMYNSHEEEKKKEYGPRVGGLSLLVPHRRYLAVFGGIWRYLAVFGGIWRYLAVFGGIWRYLAVFGGIWRYLAVFGGIWRYLAVFGICVFYASCQLSGCIRSSVYISITAINDHK